MNLLESSLITVKDIEWHIEILNKLFDVPLKPYQAERDDCGHTIANAGTFYLYHDLNGYRLERVASRGGSKDISPIGTKREVYDYVRAMIQGVELYRSKVSGGWA